MALFYRWMLLLTDMLNISTRALGWAAWAYARRWYPTLLGPGAVVAIMVLSAAETLAVVMGSYWCVL